MATKKTAPPAPAPKGKDWLDKWDPEAKTWDSNLAWKTLWITTFNLVLAFIAWFLVSALAPILNSIGFDLSKTQLYWLVALFGLAGGGLRLIWTFLPPVIGTRKLVWITTALLLLPLVGWGIAVQDANTPYVVLLSLSFLSGIGGGAFSGFMPSTSYFFPKSKQGVALGLQAGIGNFGVSLVQFFTPMLVTFALVGGTMGASQRFINVDKGIDKEVWYQNAGFFWVPFVLVGAFLAWKLLRSIPVQVNKVRDQFDIFQNKHTWLMTVLYVITFGTFAGFAATFGLLIKNIYGSDVFGNDGINAVSYAFLGALVGSAARVAAGPVADKLGGARVTMLATAGIAGASIFTAFQLSPDSVDQFPLFLWGMLAIFFFAGVGNASTFKQMPMIFERRQAGGVIGWTSAIAAFGPFVFGVIFASTDPVNFFIGWATLALAGVIITWWYYSRKNAEKRS